MTKQSLPEEPQLLRKASSIQNILASVAVSTFFVAWITGFDFVVSIFKPDFVNVLQWFRMGVILTGLTITCFVGGNKIVEWLKIGIHSYNIYKKAINEIKNKEEENNNE